MSRGDDVNVSALTVSVHAGTHVDAPFHFVPDGAGIDSVPLEQFIGPALVYHVDADRFITEVHVQAIPLEGATRVLFKTRNSELLKRREYDPNFVAFSVGAARALVARGVGLVGLDYLSVAHADEQVPVHRAFLDHGVVILEGVDLSEIAPGRRAGPSSGTWRAEAVPAARVSAASRTGRRPGRHRAPCSEACRRPCPRAGCRS